MKQTNSRLEGETQFRVQETGLHLSFSDHSCQPQIQRDKWIATSPCASTTPPRGSTGCSTRGSVTEPWSSPRRRSEQCRGHNTYFVHIQRSTALTHRNGHHPGPSPCHMSKSSPQHVEHGMAWWVRPCITLEHTLRKEGYSARGKIRYRVSGMYHEPPCSMGDAAWAIYTQLVCIVFHGIPEFHSAQGPSSLHQR